MAAPSPTVARSPQGLCLLLLPVLLAACASCASHPRAAPMTQLGERLLQGYVQPATRELHARTRQLQASLQDYCAHPADDAQRARVVQRLADTVAAWARVEPLRFGPLVENNRLEHFFFWPDPRGVVQRQVRALLTTADPALLDAPRLRQQSAAVQGLPALEYALYADEAARAIAGDDAPGRYRCAYASAIAANLAGLAGEVEAGWRTGAPLAMQFARPAARHAIYRSSTEVATEVLKTLSTALHAMRDQKLYPALGDSAAEGRGTLLPLHRSALTTLYLTAGVDALADFYATSRLGEALPAGSAWINAAVRDELTRVHADLRALRLPAALALSDATERDLLVHAALLLANARTIVDEYLVPALGVNLGFNSLDGD